MPAGSKNESDKSASSSPINSSKPSSLNVSSKAQSQKREESRKSFVASQKATAPPKTEAVVNGQNVKVDASSKHVNDLRSKPSSYIAPETRKIRYETHVTTYHYSHPYSWYAARPVMYGIGPYDNAFWWMMMEWNAERRANWLYHHQAELSREAYNDALRDAEVQQRLKALETQNIARNSHYVDDEYKENPTDAYAQSYVEAAYNPQTQNSGTSPLRVLGVIGVIALVLFCGYIIITRVKITK